MSIKSAPFYWLECDAPDCGRKSTEDGDYTAWGDTSGAEEDARDGSWLITDGKHYCPDHIAWCSSCEAEEVPLLDDPKPVCDECRRNTQEGAVTTDHHRTGRPGGEPHA